jgi:formylmethanofuran:tetrahydromethanopterin formyltransferase
MPIINKNVQVVFGTGDVSVHMGVKSDGRSGAIQFFETEPRQIGKEYMTDKKNMDIGVAPVTLIFNKIESLDAVIYQLQKLRGVMKREIVEE